MANNCENGVHGMELVLDAVTKGEPFLVATGGKNEEIDSCGRANLAGWGAFFNLIGETVAKMAAERPDDCPTCQAQAAAVLAGYIVYRAELRKAGVLPPCN